MPITAVTGSASGIGAALCTQLRAAGHSVIGIDRANSDINADLSTAEGRQQAITQVLDRCGDRLDHLVLCAGVGVAADNPGLILAVNYFAAEALLEGLVGALAKGKQPSAVVVGSIASVQPGVDQHPIIQQMLSGDEAATLNSAGNLDPSVVYAGSKLGVTIMVRRKSLEWAKQGVRLNVIAPGAVETPLLQASIDDPRYGEATRKFVSPLGRNSSPDEQAEVIRFLLSAQASFIHGTVLFTDGGMDARMRPERF